MTRTDINKSMALTMRDMVEDAVKERLRGILKDVQPAGIPEDEVRGAVDAFVLEDGAGGPRLSARMAEAIKGIVRSAAEEIVLRVLSGHV